jgi:hypothetical protein
MLVSSFTPPPPVDLKGYHNGISVAVPVMFTLLSSRLFLPRGKLVPQVIAHNYEVKDFVPRCSNTVSESRRLGGDRLYGVLTFCCASRVNDYVPFETIYYEHGAGYP